LVIEGVIQDGMEISKDEKSGLCCRFALINDRRWSDKIVRSSVIDMEAYGIAAKEVMKLESESRVRVVGWIMSYDQVCLGRATRKTVVVVDHVTTASKSRR
jgi:hypothetical protein